MDGLKKAKEGHSLSTKSHKKDSEYQGSLKQERANESEFCAFSIPISIVSEANSNEHWSKKSKRHAIQKMLVKSWMNQQKIPLLPCIVKLTRAAPRKFDSDNLQSAFKYVRDAIGEYLTDEEQAGRGDDDPRITWEYYQKKTSQKESYIEISIWTRE